MKRIFTQNTGSTLIELIIYIALVAIFLSGAILFSWDASYAREKAIKKLAVDQNARIVLARISYEISKSQGINSVSANNLVLENGINDTTISLNNGVIQISYDGVGPYDLTSNQVFVTNLNFSETALEDDNTNSIQTQLSLRQANANVTGEFEATTTMSSSSELNNQFNQARQLLVDLSNMTLSANNRIIENITIENTGANDITIDQIYISWSNTSGEENITELSIDGSNLWIGSQPSGSTINVTDYTLANASGITIINNISFDSQMDLGIISLNFILSDGSIHKTLVQLPAGNGPTPTPTPTISPTPTPTPTITPTPTPTPTSCPAICTTQGLTGGTCRKNPATCNANGESNQPTGDVFCTGGKDADTCCCAP